MLQPQTTSMRLLKHIAKYTALLNLFIYLIEFDGGFISTQIGFMFNIPRTVMLFASGIIINAFILLAAIYVFYRQAKQEPQYPYWTGLVVLLITIVPMLWIGPFPAIPGMIIFYLATTFIANVNKKTELAFEKPVQAKPLIFFPIGIIKFSILLILFPPYVLYWGYQNWQYIKQRDHRDINPAVRSLFPIIYLYPLLKEINKIAQAHNLPGIKYPKLIFTLYILFCIANSIYCGLLAAQAILPIIIFPVLLVKTIFLLTIYLIPQRIINQLNQQQDIANELKNKKISWANLIYISFGALSLMSGITYQVIAMRPAVDNAYAFYEYKQYKKAYHYATIAADQGNAKAKYLLAKMFLSGIGVTRYEAEGMRLLESAAQLKYPNANYDMGIIYSQGLYGITADPKKAAEYYQTAVDQGDAFAATNLAIFYHKGIGVEKNIAKSDQLMLLAANRGDGVAMYNIGLKYQNEIQSPDHYAIAAKWFEKSMHYYTDTNPCAPHDLGLLYATGKGVKKNPEKAKRLLITSAIVMKYTTPIAKQLDYKTRQQLTHVFAEYQIANATHIDNTQQLSEKYSPAALAKAKEMADYISDNCWK